MPIYENKFGKFSFKEFLMKKMIIFSLFAYSLLNAGILDYFKDEDKPTKEIEKCTVTNQVLNTQNQFMPIITGTTSCDSANLQFKLSCNYSVVSIESGSSYNGVFEHSFTSASSCDSPSVTVSVR